MNLFIDCDGVLTDGKLYIDANGYKMFKAFHTRDVRALREFVAHGWYVCIVTADDSDTIKHFANKCGVDLHVLRDKSKMVISLIDAYAVGDDAWDVGMLMQAKYRYCPKDADESVRSLEGMNVLPVTGGSGVIATLLRNLIANSIIKPL